MTGTDDEPSTTADERWWGDRSRYDEPAAVAAKAAFGHLMRRGRSEDVLSGLELVWMQVDRASLWLESHVMEWKAATDTSVAEKTCLMTLAPLALHLRAVSTLGRADLRLLPAALMAGRPAFEIGLRIAWIYSADGLEESNHRALRFRHDTEKWMRRVGSRLEATGTSSGDRWRKGADAHRAVIDTYSKQAAIRGEIRSPPPVLQLLQALSLERLYHGYQLASAQAHGSVAGGGEIQAVRRERSPYGLYWPQDWALPVNLCAWGSLFVAEHYPATQLDVGPIRGLMWAADLLAELAPGPGEDDAASEDGC